MTTKIERYSVDEYQLLVKQGGVITLNPGTTGSVVISGNLTVYGSSTNISSQDLEIEDNTILLNKGETGPGVSLVTAGLIIDRGTLPDAQLFFDESKEWLDSQNSLTDSTGAFVLSNTSGDLVGIFTNNISTNNNDQSFIQTDGRIDEKICQAHTIDPILMGIRVSGKLGSGSDIKQSYVIFEKNAIMPLRNEVEEIFNDLLFIARLNVEFELNNYQIIGDIIEEETKIKE